MNPVRIILLLWVLAVMGTAKEATATNGEIFSGDGSNDSVGGTVVSYTQERVNLVFPLMKRLDAYAGLEYTKSSVETEGYTSPYRYSFYFPDAGFGLRLKPVARDRFQLYVALGAIVGEVFYKADFANSDFTLLSNDRGRTFFIAPRFGFGANFRVYRELRLCAEISVTGPIPGFNVVVANKNSGKLETLKLNNDKDMVGFMLGLRYDY